MKIIKTYDITFFLINEICRRGIQITNIFKSYNHYNLYKLNYINETKLIWKYKLIETNKNRDP